MMKYARLVVSLLIALAFVSPLATGQPKAGKADTNADLEKQLYGIEQKWLQSEHDKKTDIMKDLAADQFIEILAGARVVDKQEIMARVGRGTPGKPGTGAFADEFKLIAVYGNVAIATDRTVTKAIDANGNIAVTRELRSLRIFAKENGKWKLAGTAQVPIEQ